MNAASRSLRLFVLGGSVIAMASCAGGEAPTVPVPGVAAVQVSPGADTLFALGRTRQLTATVKDAAGATVPGQTVTWTSSAPGVATVSATGLVTAVANGAATIQASAGGTSGAAQVFVAQLVATVTVTPGTTGLTAIGSTQQFTAVAKDSGGTAVTIPRFIWISSDPSVATVDSLGKATSRRSGQTTITAAGQGIPGNAVLSVTQAATQLAFSLDPASGIAGEPLSPAVQVEIRDAGGALVSNARDPITLALAVSPAGGSLGGTKTVNAVGGIATFSGLYIERAGAGYQLGAASGTLASDTSTAFNIGASFASQVQWGFQPVSALGNQTMAPVTVFAFDRFGNQAPSRVEVTLAVDPWEATGPAGVVAEGAFLFGTTVLDAVGGEAVFSDLVINRPAARYRLGAQRYPSSDTPVLSGAFNVNLTLALAGSQSDVAVGGSHACSVATTGLFCWGSDQFQQLGRTTGSSADDSVPNIVTGGFTVVTAGRDFTCALNAVGAASCWGPGGALGNGSGATQSFPTPVSGGLTFTAISAGRDHACGVVTGGDAYCWGSNGFGQLGDSTKAYQSTPVLVHGDLTFMTVSAGYDHTCGLVTTGAAYCWGRNAAGQLGDGSNATDSVPVAVTGGHTFTQLDAGGFHTCALKSTGLAYCWGEGNQYQLGNGGSVAVNAPSPVTGGPYNSISAGVTHTCVIESNFYAECWGKNDARQADPTFACPTCFVSGKATQSGYNRVWAGSESTCARSTTGKIACWGKNERGQLGAGHKNETPRVELVVQ